AVAVYLGDDPREFTDLGDHLLGVGVVLVHDVVGQKIERPLVVALGRASLLGRLLEVASNNLDTHPSFPARLRDGLIPSAAEVNPILLKNLGSSIVRRDDLADCLCFISLKTI